MDVSSDKSPIATWLRQPAALGLLAAAGLILVVGLTVVHVAVGLAAAILVLLGAVIMWRGVCQAFHQAEHVRAENEQALRDERQRLEKDLEASVNALRREQDSRVAEQTRADEDIRQLRSESQALTNRVQSLEADQARLRSELEQERNRLRQESQKASAHLQQAEVALTQAREEGQRALRDAQEKAERVLEQTRQEANRAVQQAQGERDQARRKVEELQGAYDRLDKNWRADLDQEARPPLTAMVGFAQLLEIDALSPEQLHNVQQILKGSRHILGWIDQRLKPS